jgi:hypothetical protein
MRPFGRFNIMEMSLNRVLASLIIRINEIPHSFAWMYSSLGARNRAKLEEYKGIHTGERCFIIANGPSLRKINLELLKNDLTFGLNRIYLSFEHTSFRPTYYVAMNELILEQFSGEIQALDMPKFLNWNRRVFFNSRNTNTVFLKSKLVLKDSFQYDLVRPMVLGGTVTYVALQIAYYMGFSKVILIGLDHNYVDKGIPNRTEMRSADVDDSHFHPQYFPKGSKWQLPDLLRSELDYEIARKVFEKDEREIVDATIGGMCKIFKKTDFPSLFNLPSAGN